MLVGTVLEARGDWPQDAGQQDLAIGHLLDFPSVCRTASRETTAQLR